MATIPTYRVSQPTIETDRLTLKALLDLSDYTPRNNLYGIVSLQELEILVAQAEQAEARALVALEAARTQLLTATWAFHNAILAAKAEVIAQYGLDSLAVHAIGLKRKSDRKRRARRRKEAAQ